MLYETSNKRTYCLIDTDGPFILFLVCDLNNLYQIVHKWKEILIRESPNLEIERSIMTLYCQLNNVLVLCPLAYYHLPTSIWVNFAGTECHKQYFCADVRFPLSYQTQSKN